MPFVRKVVNDRSASTRRATTLEYSHLSLTVIARRHRVYQFARRNADMCQRYDHTATRRIHVGPWLARRPASARRARCRAVETGRRRRSPDREKYHIGCAVLDSDRRHGISRASEFGIVGSQSISSAISAHRSSDSSRSRLSSGRRAATSFASVTSRSAYTQSTTLSRDIVFNGISYRSASRWTRR